MKKLSLFVVIGIIVALFLVWGGVLLGLNPAVRSALDRFVSVAASDDASYQLQREVLDKLKTTYYKPVDERLLETRAIDGMVAGLGDPYTVYMDPEQYASFLEQASGLYSGVGMVVEMSSHFVTVVSTFKGRPAAEGGIMPGDIIIEVDGVSTEGLNLDEVVSKIKGEEGTEVAIEIYRPAPAATSTTAMLDGADTNGETTDTTDRTTEDNLGEKAAGTAQLPPGGKTIRMTLIRQIIEVPVLERTMMTAGDKDVGVISFYTFSEGSAVTLRSNVDAILEEGADVLVLDLRGNSGGLLNEAVDVASIFLENGVVVTTQGLHSPKETYEVTGKDHTNVPLYILTDRFTASASEIVSGALQDDDRATLVGETTFGKGLVQTLETLSNGGALKVTTAVYLTPDGRDINKTGIVPDVKAVDDLTTEPDECLQAVLDLIAGTSAAIR